MASKRVDIFLDELLKEASPSDINAGISTGEYITPADLALSDYLTTSTGLQKINNLSDVSNSSTALSNLGGIPLAGTSALTGSLLFNFGSHISIGSTNTHNSLDFQGTFVDLVNNNTTLTSGVFLYNDNSSSYINLQIQDSSNSANNRRFQLNNVGSAVFYGSDIQYDADYSSIYTSRSLVDYGL